jgi:hypothetical protein
MSNRSENAAELVISQTQDGMLSLPVSINRDAVWFNRNQLVTLFERDMKTIGKRINNALQEEMAFPDLINAKFETTALKNIYQA